MFKPTPIWPDFTLVNFSYEFGQIMTRHDFLEARWVIFSNVLTFGKFSVSRKPIMNGGAIRPVGLLFLFCHEASLGWHKQHIIRSIWLNHSKGCFLKVKGQNFDIFGLLDHFLKNWPVTFFLFWQELFQGWY